MRFMNWFQWRFLHDILGWGYPAKRCGGDAFMPTYYCKYCLGTVAQDSQGNYFHLSKGVRP